MAAIQIFKKGTHTASDGTSLAFGEDDLHGMVGSYNPDLHEAPLVVGHPRDNLPAYGWVKSLAYSDGILAADPHQVDPEFAELVNSGKFKKVSASFYTPDSPSNPVPGKYYLRHVGFLGAQPPAVKGLKSASFKDSEEGIVEFADWGDMQNASLWRRMRDFFIAQFGLDTADNIIPDYAVSSLEQDALQDDDDDDQPSSSLTPQYREPSIKGDEMSVEDKARLAALEEENKRLKEVEASRRLEGIRMANAAFAEGLVKEGRLLPAYKGVCSATLDFLESQEKVVEFSEGGVTQSVAKSMKAFLQKLPVQVEFREIAGSESAAGTLSYAAAPGFEVDAERLELHAKALAYQEKNKVDYVTAVKAVGGN